MLHIELNKIGLTVGVLALVLAVPLAIVANLLTPSIGKWYGATSHKRRIKRLS
jgi:hypothetical protein